MNRGFVFEYLKRRPHNFWLIGEKFSLDYEMIYYCYVQTDSDVDHGPVLRKVKDVHKRLKSWISLQKGNLLTPYSGEPDLAICYLNG